MAILDQRPVKVELPCYRLGRRPVPTSDGEWSNLIVLTVAHIVGFCFSKDSERSFARWNELREGLDEWNASRPSTFDAYYYRERNTIEGRYFPDIWLSAQWHGSVHSKLIRIRH